MNGHSNINHDSKKINYDLPKNFRLSAQVRIEKKSLEKILKEMEESKKDSVMANTELIHHLHIRDLDFEDLDGLIEKFSGLVEDLNEIKNKLGKNE